MVGNLWSRDRNYCLKKVGLVAESMMEDNCMDFDPTAWGNPFEREWSIGGKIFSWFLSEGILVNDDFSSPNFL